eukprot:gene13625-16106_t
MSLQRVVMATFESFCEQVVTPDEAEALFSDLQFEEDSLDNALPSVVTDSESEDDSEEDEEGSEEEEGDEFCEVPDGFTIIQKPTNLLSGSDLQKLSIYMRWNIGWCLGKITAFVPSRYRHTYDITWEEGKRGHKLSLQKKIQPQDDDGEAIEGAWVYMRKTSCMNG